MLKRRFQIVLPLTFNDGRSVPGEAFGRTREELVERFGAAALLKGAVEATWEKGGARYDDESLRLVVDVEDSADNRRFFADYKAVLAQRFEQEEMYIVSWLLDVV